MMRRIEALLFVSFFLLFACSRPDKSAANQTTVSGPPVPGDSIVVRLEADLDTLNPIITTSTYSSIAYWGGNYSFVGEMLMQYDPKDWSFSKPLLAEGPPEISADHLTYTYTLRDGIKWHDGQPLTTADFVFSAKAIMSPLVDAAPLRSTVTDLINVEALDGRRIRYTLSKPNVTNSYNLGSLNFAAKHVFDPNGVLDAYTIKDIVGPKGKTDPKIKKFAEEFNQNPANRNPIGTGPYKFQKWDAGSELVVVRNPDYWGATKPFLDKITFRIIKDNPAALTALKSGDVDFNPRLTTIQFAQQTSGPGFDNQFTKTKYKIPVFYYLVWNEKRPWFKDKRVRQAMTMLVNRQQIIDTIRFGLATIATSPLNPSSPDFNPNIKPVPYDPKRAAELLDEAGWKDTNGDGIRDKDGVPFRFEFLASSQSSYTDQLLPILKEEFRKVGIDMVERKLDFTVVTNAMRDQNFDAATGAWASNLVYNPDQLWHSKSAENRGSNFGSFKNAEVDKLLEQARVEFDPEKRKQFLWRFQEILHEEQPYTFLFYPEESAAWSKRFQGVEWIPNRPGYDLKTWWVPTALRKGTAASSN